MNASANTDARNLRCRELACLIGMALSLAACGGGGGGGNVKPSTTSGGSSSSSPTLPQPPVDAQLSITDTYAAHNQGYTGTGVTIGVVDSGIMRSNPTVSGRVLQEQIYVDSSTNNTSVDDVVGHGTWVSEIAAGTPFAQFPGGIAPGADLVSARIIADNAPDDNGSTAPSQVTTSDAQFFGQVNANLMSAGVKVMNNSWGGITWDTTSASINQAFDQAYSPFVNQQGGLVVFAAGNDSQANPSTIAMLPNVAPDLAKGWLVAVAVNSNNPTQLESYSNQCGAAMNYCLAAPGDVIVLDKGTTASTTNPNYYIVEGTSFAAPEVSGAAALVWQAYPYFTNDLVRQTLLGTADPLGGSQPNPTYGYGELDVGRAVNGPMQFNWGDVTVSFSGNSNWNNPISGAGGLIKQGSGTLNLTQPSSYTGETQVQGGVLTAVSLAGTAAISSGATLSGMSAVGGNVSNAGTLAIANTNVNVGGNYTQQSGGQLAVSLGSTLNVAGTASIAGNLLVTGTNSGYVANSQTNVLVAKGGLTGTFAQLATASNVLLTASLNYNTTTAWLNVQQVQVSAVQGTSYTTASYSAAQRVDAAFNQINMQLASATASGSPAASGLISGAATLQQTATLGNLQQSLESLSGQLHAASAAMTFEAIDAGTRALANHFDQLLSAPPTQQLGAWVQNLGYQGSMSRSGYNNVAYDLNGWMVGQDFRVDGSGVAGFALSGTQGLGRLTESADQGYSRAVEGMLYGGTMRGNWYALGRFGFGDYQETMQRQVQLGGQATGAGSDSSGRYGVAYGESGYRMMLGDTRVMPYASLEYAQIQRDGFDEVGGDGFGLKADALTTARWQAGLGVRATRNWQLGRAGSLSLQGQLAWQQSFGLRGEVFDASFTGVNQWAPLGGIGLARYGGLAGATLNWTMNPRSSLALDYESYFGQGQEATMAMLNYRWSF
ncbi:autotransporter serine protease [Rhodanobacter sp. DHG33]|uniref:autotransporter serine protease n=1 Tax=Rhodanobacter sp. DHG33 TaxID=2775921 RepID=UPI00177ACD38|nr:autotransporter serine protease [Rhodanobacter sp. DHG33]MBD8899960.1 S8 family serine peptidase [Rhodanobacter sp. DHG33]